MKKILLIALLIFTGIIANAQYTKLFDFADDTEHGYNTPSDLIYDDTFLYGMTNAGGENNKGTIFKLKFDGTGYTKLLDFAGATNGSNPNSSLISDGTFLYGTTAYGGIYGYGTIFKIKPDGTGYSNLHDFNNSDGSMPRGSLIFDGAFLYGMTAYGGTSTACGSGIGCGTIFKITPNGTGFANVHNFNNTNGSQPHGSLISDGTFLYGMTYQGGNGNNGVIFKIMPNGTSYTAIHSFAGNPTDGNNPEGSLFFDGTFLYGMAQNGGTYNKGIVFKVLPNGSQYSVLLHFNYTDGYYPTGSLISDGTFIYGMTYQGGANNLGVIYKIMPDGTGYSKLLDFAGPLNGSNPFGSLISDDTYFYGMTQAGGINDKGTVFRYNQLCTDIAIYQSPTICTGENITVGNNTYTVSGTYNDTLISTLGCDSTITTDLTVDICIGVSNAEPTWFFAYPNPSENITIIETKITKGFYRLSDINGKLLSSGRVNSAKFILDLSKLCSGVYFINISDGEKQVTGKILKE